MIENKLHIFESNLYSSSDTNRYRNYMIDIANLLTIFDKRKIFKIASLVPLQDYLKIVILIIDHISIFVVASLIIIKIFTSVFIKNH